MKNNLGLLENTEGFLGSTKLEISTGKKLKSRKKVTLFPPPEKMSCYAPDLLYPYIPKWVQSAMALRSYDVIKHRGTWKFAIFREK